MNLRPFVLTNYVIVNGSYNVEVATNIHRSIGINTGIKLKDLQVTLVGTVFVVYVTLITSVVLQFI